MTPAGIAVGLLNFLVMATFWGGLVYVVRKGSKRAKARKVSRNSGRHL